MKRARRRIWKIIGGIIIVLVVLIFIGAMNGSQTQQESATFSILCNGQWQSADKGCDSASSSLTSAVPIEANVPAPAQTQSSGGELCAGKRYTACTSGQKFYCGASGGECIPSDNTLCNGKWYTPCASGTQFSCPASGPAQCVAPGATSTASVPEARTITTKANVGLLCHYKITDTSLKSLYSYDEDSNGELLNKASGVIINPQGYILTAKHLVDPSWENWAYASTTSADEQRLNSSLQFDYCDVGMPQTDNLPTPDEIKSTNPSTQLSNPFPYIATLYFEPSRGSMSDLEYGEMDFAVLKISGPMHGCATFNLCTLPNSFPYNPVLYNVVPGQPGMPNLLVDFGYPAEAINSYGGGFTDFYLKGAVGPLMHYYGGDQYFKGQPLSFQWTANDVLPGRSGSPVYWQGYVVGVEYAIGSTNSSIDEALGMPAIYQILKDNGLGQILSTQ